MSKNTTSKNPPAIGTRLVKRGQRYVVSGHERYTTKTGRQTVLLAIRSHCADCGATFTTKATHLDADLSRRCDEHKAPGKKVST